MVVAFEKPSGTGRALTAAGPQGVFVCAQQITACHYQGIHHHVSATPEQASPPCPRRDGQQHSHAMALGARGVDRSLGAGPGGGSLDGVARHQDEDIKRPCVSRTFVDGGRWPAPQQPAELHVTHEVFWRHHAQVRGAATLLLRQGLLRPAR